MIGFYNYTVYLTYVGMIASVIGMFLAVDGKPTAAVICLMISGICDLFDGKIARTKKDRTTEEKRFGIQIDSLSDVICFGVFPAVLGYTIGADSWWQMAIAALFVLCGLIRLAYYNVTEELRQNSTDKNRSMYKGVPITVSSILVPVLMCFYPGSTGTFHYLYTALLALMGICYIAPLNVRKPGKTGAVIMIAIGAAVFLVMIFCK